MVDLKSCLRSSQLTRPRLGACVLAVPVLCFLTLIGSPAVAEPTQEELEAASLLASRATFGMSYPKIVEMAEQGLDEWLDEQLDMECSTLRVWEDRLLEMDENGEFDHYRAILTSSLGRKTPTN